MVTSKIKISFRRMKRQSVKTKEMVVVLLRTYCRIEAYFEELGWGLKF